LLPSFSPCFSALLPLLSGFPMVFISFSLHKTVSPVLLDPSHSWSQSRGCF
jgi:hypothetical protein